MSIGGNQPIEDAAPASQVFGEVIAGNLGVFEDLVEQAGYENLPGVNRHNRRRRLIPPLRPAARQ